MSETASSSRLSIKDEEQSGPEDPQSHGDGDAILVPPVQMSRIDDANTAAVANNRDAFLQNATISVNTANSLVERPLHTLTEGGSRIQPDSSSPSFAASKQIQDPASIPTSPDRNASMLEYAAPPNFAQRQPLRSNLSVASMASSLSPRSALSSPQLAALSDITPLPSPLIGADSPALWGRARAGSGARPISQGSIEVKMGAPAIWKDPRDAVDSNGLKSPAISRSSSKIKKSYVLAPTGLEPQGAQEQVARQNSVKKHGRNRSISEFVPEALHNVRLRNVTVSSSHPPGLLDTHSPSESHLHREKNLAEQRGIHSSSAPESTLPTPPASNKSATEDEEEEEKHSPTDNVEYMIVRCGKDNVKKYFRPIRVLGQGTFSKVLLATNQKLGRQPLEESKLNPKKLVAIKIVEHGPAGGADKERIETSLKREIEILKSISHPSLVHLKAFDQDEQRALLVLTYCPGCDLFDLASEHRSLLSPSLIQRMFAELVSAVLYLHDNYIVHRDIKLESEPTPAFLPPSTHTYTPTNQAPTTQTS